VAWRQTCSLALAHMLMLPDEKELTIRNWIYPYVPSMFYAEDLLSVFCMEQSEKLVKVSGLVVVFLLVVCLHVC
jgi:hypothetical protein